MTYYSNEEISIGEPFVIDYLYNEPWYKMLMRTNVGFILPAYLLNPGESREFDIDLKYYFVNLFPGKYRNRNDLDPWQWDGEERSPIYETYTEFELDKSEKKKKNNEKSCTVFAILITLITKMIFTQKNQNSFSNTIAKLETLLTSFFKYRHGCIYYSRTPRLTKESTLR